MPNKMSVFTAICVFLLSISFFEGGVIQEDEKTVIQLENEAVLSIEQEGIGRRFTVEEFGPRSHVGPSRVTLSQNDPDSISVDTEYPEDVIARKGNTVPDIWGRGSIHRFQGRVELKVESESDKTKRFVFVGEGEKGNRLTFWVGDNSYVYLRGKGRVIMPSGTRIVLPRDYDEKEIEDYFGKVEEQPVSPPKKEKKKEPPSQPDESYRTVKGYRVQVAALNRKEDADKMAADIKAVFQDVGVYVKHIPPYWKVRVGNCRTQKEAALLRDRLVGAGYSTAWVVSTTIEVERGPVSQ